MNQEIDTLVTRLNTNLAIPGIGSSTDRIWPSEIRPQVEIRPRNSVQTLDSTSSTITVEKDKVRTIEFDLEKIDESEY